MGYSRVRFNNFRNIEPREIKWSPGLNLLTGPNGSGKTNILEGINIVSGWGPLERGTRSSSLPTWNSGSSEVQLTGQLDDENGEIIKVKISSRYTVRIDERSITATELRWKIPVLSFLPNDMSIIEGPASFRRRLMDMVLALIVPVYASRLNDYRRGIRQKTAILRNGGRTELIDRALLPLASWVWKMREEALTMISESMNDMCGLLPCPTDISLLRGGSGYFASSRRGFQVFSETKQIKGRGHESSYGRTSQGRYLDKGQRRASCAFPEQRLQKAHSDSTDTGSSRRGQEEAWQKPGAPS